MTNNEKDVEKAFEDRNPNHTKPFGHTASSRSSSSSDHLRPPRPRIDYDDNDSIENHSIHSAAAGGVALAPIRSKNGQDLTQVKSAMSTLTRATTSDPSFEIDWEGDDDPANPRNWSNMRKAWIIAVTSFATVCVVQFSTSYTSGLPGLQESFNLSETSSVLGVTLYMMGVALGSLILAPISEMYGRRLCFILSMLSFGLFVLPCALAQNFTTILVCRFFAAIAGSAMISNAPGTIHDISNEENRALFLSFWSIGPMNGPVIGPLIGGFVFQYLGWRWTNWVVLIFAGVSLITMSTLKETYAPALLRKKAKLRREETGDDRWWSRYEDRTSFLTQLKTNLSRPFIMMVTEPICIFWDVYIAIVYGILYLCFVAYPIVFMQLRGWSPGLTGLSYIGIGIGCTLVIVSEPLIRRVVKAGRKDPETGKPTPEAVLPVLCFASILLPIGQFWFSWTCTPNVHWIAPLLAGIPFCAGNGLLFIYVSKYLVDSYGVYAASALAGNAVFRSILGGTLPLAGPALYSKLGANWAGTLLGFLQVLCIPIPFVFYRYGPQIRQRSALIRRLQEDSQRSSRRQAKRQAETEKRLEADMAIAGMGGVQEGAAMTELEEHHSSEDEKEMKA